MGGRSRMQTTVGWSKKAFIEELSGFNDPASLDHYINASTNVHTTDNRFGGLYSFNYDVLRSSHAAASGSPASTTPSAAASRSSTRPTTSRRAARSSPIPSDHRFFLSFTLAGLGNFSPFNGALSGVPR